MKKLFTHLTILATLMMSLMASSCRGDDSLQKPYGGLYKEPLLEWGASMETIKSKLGKPTEVQPKRLVYQLGFINTLYDFEDNKLYEVMISNQERLHTFDEFFEHLNSKYICVSSSQGYATFTFADGTGTIRLAKNALSIDLAFEP